jgi:hypothetical protein
MVTRTHNRISEDGGARAEQGRSLTDLIRDLRDETTTLMRQEFALAKTELTEKTSRVSRNLGYLAIGGAVAYAGALLLVMGVAAGLYVMLVAMGLSHEAAGWLAPLIVGGALAGVGYSMIQKAIATLRHESFVPERTIESLKEDKQLIQERTR